MLPLCQITKTEENRVEKKICQTSETILNNRQQVVTVTEFCNGVVIIEIEFNYK